jgi:hypothetical protein
VREFNGVAFNEFLIRKPNRFEAQAEIIILTSEPKWDLDGGSFSTRRIVQEHRFVTSREGLRDLADALMKQAAVLDSIGVCLEEVSPPKDDVSP